MKGVYMYKQCVPVEHNPVVFVSWWLNKTGRGWDGVWVTKTGVYKAEQSQDKLEMTRRREKYGKGQHHATYYWT